MAISFLIFVHYKNDPYHLICLKTNILARLDWFPCSIYQLRMLIIVSPIPLIEHAICTELFEHVLQQITWGGHITAQQICSLVTALYHSSIIYDLFLRQVFNKVLQINFIWAFLTIISTSYRWVGTERRYSSTLASYGVDERFIVSFYAVVAALRYMSAWSL